MIYFRFEITFKLSLLMKLEEEKIPTEDTTIMLGDFIAQIIIEEYLKNLPAKHTIHKKTNVKGLCNSTLKTIIMSYSELEHLENHKIV